MTSKQRKVRFIFYSLGICSHDLLTLKVTKIILVSRSHRLKTITDFYLKVMRWPRPAFSWSGDIWSPKISPREIEGKKLKKQSCLRSRVQVVVCQKLIITEIKVFGKIAFGQRSHRTEVELNARRLTQGGLCHNPIMRLLLCSVDINCQNPSIVKRIASWFLDSSSNPCTCG